MSSLMHTSRLAKSTASALLPTGPLVFRTYLRWASTDPSTRTGYFERDDHPFYNPSTGSSVGRDRTTFTRVTSRNEFDGVGTSSSSSVRNHGSARPRPNTRAGLFVMRGGGIDSVRAISTSPLIRSGHNRWSKIRHKKGAVDGQRSALFSKISNEIYTSIKLAPTFPLLSDPLNPSSAAQIASDPADPMTNPRFAAILAKAREVGYPKSNVDAAVHKALNPHEGVSLSTTTYEAIVPPPKSSTNTTTSNNSTSLIIECLTDNPNRSISRVKEQLSRFGGRLSPCAFMFERKGLIRVRSGGGVEAEEVYETLFEVGVDAGAEDVRVVEDEAEEGEGAIAQVPVYEVITPLSSLSTITQILASHASPRFAILASEPAYLPHEPLHLPEDADAATTDQTTDDSSAQQERISEEQAERVANLLAALDEVGDVTRVWTNVAGL